MLKQKHTDIRINSKNNPKNFLGVILSDIIQLKLKTSRDIIRTNLYNRLPESVNKNKGKLQKVKFCLSYQLSAVTSILILIDAFCFFVLNTQILLQTHLSKIEEYVFTDRSKVILNTDPGLTSKKISGKNHVKFILQQLYK